MNDDPRTPRDWLHARHSVKEGQLTALRRTALPSSALSWREALSAIFRPHRRLWQAMGVAWLLMAACHLTLSPRARSPLNPAAPPPEAVARWLAQFSSHEILAHLDQGR